ncbi:MAG: sigma-54 dependent transcriptional regulator [Rickettsia endosymbiont of Ixodes persulcatus]|nr:sigma-54 dependent transcriptional regulator [Rickettsia endosymbiont of Ixodes persulcatus]MCZ6903335.1 sigma-54 dependent transcriptional regulator [Rickettsia endosymbiont of Ixodes persulcatus]MCZ6908655.1 sigma-54 dependent transcriptional regulator [Rickettsia endosymbiont of Ixodes persulcatus]MCZ6910235.1 sigma-54 dependent transcriptional regulator [Rickettsia endosymbiont of Ixodes persulcatus]MCZ6913483.1 sigma-54 dependent transcriptional regulator [Rickettsia endosymbiont of Ixo
MSPIDVLIVDDEEDIRNIIAAILKDEGFNPKVAASSTQALKILSEKLVSAVILDIWLQGSEIDGLGILEIIKKRYPLMPVIIISGHGTIETAVNAIKMGAYDYIEKPFNNDKLVILLKRACEVTKLKRENIDLKSKVIDKTELVGGCSVTLKYKMEIEKAASSSSRIMIHGKVGSGKELTARLIHKQSKRVNNPFIIFSPTCMTTDKINQELFGESEKQENNNKRPTILEFANNGTLYIDEVSNIPIPIQVKLLKFLKDQTIYSTKPCGKNIKVDIKIITGTSKNIQDEVNNGRFLEDLYYRLNVSSLKVPSLYERKEDIPLLVKYFVKQLAKFSGLKERTFADETIAALQSYEWPGNIRQLRNIVEWTLIMNPLTTGNNEIIKPYMIPSEILANSANLTKLEDSFDILSMPLREAREVFERQYLSAQMSRFNNNISKTSSFVGMERSALHRKLKLLSLHIPANRINEEEYEEANA